VTDDDLAARLARAEFTPGARHFAPLVAWVAEDGVHAAAAAKALARAGAAAAKALAAALPAASPAARVALLGALAQIADPLAPGLIARALADEDAGVRRAAARGLGRKGRDDQAAGALAAALGAEKDQRVHKALVMALGKVGGAAAQLPLSRIDSPGPVLSRARLMAARDAIREAGGATIRMDVPPPRGLRALLRCRTGLETMLGEELAAASAVRVQGTSPGQVDIALGGPLAALLVARTWLEVAFVLTPPPRSAPAVTEVERAVRLLAQPQVASLLATLTTGIPRLRLTFAGGGHRRGLTWQVAEALAATAGAPISDSRQAPWTAHVILGRQAASDRLKLSPHLADSRFAWRQADVPAASHPTIAAALARWAAPRANDLVWDPFVGSGGELIETSRLAPAARLLGTDLDGRALAAAGQNLAAAQVTARLERADALEYRPEPLPSLIISNPPMGRRVRRGDVAELLAAFCTRLPHLLAPGGRLVWASALPARTKQQARLVGLQVRVLGIVDLGGFSADIQEIRRAEK
jgi:23S rRNA G2445 N2-methylase RlmL